jgi:murein DD-endopeptidase MepM/ murein hydrolase activator NlpD/uncharacterized protein YbjQ (UPF0145 family)
MATRQSYKNDDDIDSRLNPAELHAREKDTIPGYDRQNDGLDDHPITAGDASGTSGDLGGDDPAKNIHAAKDAEANPMNSSVTGSRGKKQPFDLKSVMKKKGPLGALLLLLGGGGIAITGLTAPSLLLVQITDMFTNNFNDANTALSVRSRVAIANKIDKTKNSFAETKDGKCGIRCKSTTMSDSMVRNLEAKGYKITPDKTNAKFGRRIVQTMELPGGKIVTNGNEFKQAMKDPAQAARFNKVFNSKTAYFLNTKFGSMLKSKLGITKAYKLAGDSKEKFKESFRRAVGLPPATTVDPNKPASTPEETLKESPRLQKVAAVVGKLSNKPSNVIGAACFAYNTNRAVNASVKVAKYAAYASFAMTFLNAAHKLKAADGGGIDPLVVSELGDMLTYTDPNKTKSDGTPNELYGLSATDSYGYKAAAYGDSGTIPEYVKMNSMESTGLLAVLGAITFFASSTPEARATAHGACSAVNNPFASFIQCAPSIPTVIGYAGCVFGNIVLGAVIGEVISAAIPVVIQKVVEANVNKLDETTKGALAGDALYPGAAAILGGHAASYGMKAGTKDEIKQYIALGNDVRKEDEAIARLDAKDTPLDVYNQYSFLGSMARNLNIASLTNSSLTQTASLMTSTIPRSLASLTTNSNAGTYMPLAENKANQYGNPDCGALNSIGVVGDSHCMPAYVKSAEELNAKTEDNLNFMIAGGYINEETGEPTTEPGGIEFQKYLDNCVFNTDAPGETSKPIESGDDGDYEWYIGANCGKDTVKSDNDVKNFRIYAMDEPVNAAIIGENTVLHASSGSTDVDTSTGSETTNENSGNVTAGGWTFPTTANAPLVSPFGQRGGGFHTGIDLGVPSGSPFYATKDGVIQTREYNVYSIAGGSWCPVLGSMTDPNQKDIWITHDVDGVTYTSVYAHMSRYLKKTGDVVKAGDLIGYTGGSGCSSGPHVHFEIWQGKASPSVPGPGMRNPWPLINP